jgi:perosamine synthetase
MKRTVYLDAPNVGRLEKKSIGKAIDEGYVSSIGPLVGAFESEFSDYLGSRRAVSTQSGTAAIHIALHELGVGKGDEVIVPSLTFIATVNPVCMVGAKPVIVDVNRDTWNLEPELVERSITKRTKAIIPVHLYGNPCDMGALMKISRKHGIPVIEDATESLGASFKGKQTGTIGKFGCFSFNGNKIITTGGGGMIAGNDEQSMKHVKFLVNQARDESKGYYHPEIGFNYRMTNIEAALGLAQMMRLGAFLKKKQQFHSIYADQLGDSEDIVFQKEYPAAASSWWLTCVTFSDRIDVAAIITALRNKGVQSRRVFMPLKAHPPYWKARGGPCSNAEYIYRRGLCLPCSTLNNAKDIAFTCKILKEEVKKHG